MALSDKKRMEIANVCYANVAGSFADFCNVRMRGNKFDWRRFVAMMEKESSSWMFLHSVRGDNKLVAEAAEQFAGEIAQTLLDRAGFINNDVED